MAPHWIGQFEYLFSGPGATTFPGQRVDSDFKLQELRAGLNYQFGGDPAAGDKAPTVPGLASADWINFHGQTTFVEQAYPAFQSPYDVILQHIIPATGSAARRNI